MPRDAYELKGRVGYVEQLITPTTEPSHVEAEWRLLITVISNNKTFYEAPDLRVEHFFDPVSAKVYQELARLIPAAKPDEKIDGVTLKGVFQGPNDLPTEGGWQAYYVGLTQYLHHHKDVPGCAASIIEKWRLREAMRILKTGHDLAQSGDPENTAERIAQRVFNGLMELEAAGVERRTVMVGDAFRKAIDDVQAIRRGEADGGMGFDLEPVEKAIGKLRPSWFYILGGRPGSGKTSLAAQLMLGVARGLKEEPPKLFTPDPCVAFFSLEMPNEQVSGWVGCNVGDVSNEIFDADRDFTAEEAERIILTQKELDTLPIALINGDGKPMTIEEIVMRAMTLNSTRRVRLVVIDHIQRIKKGNDQTAETQKITSMLKDLARKLNAAVIGLAQLTKDSEKRDNPTPRMGDVMWGGEADADVVFLLHRPEDNLEEIPTEPRPGENDSAFMKRRNGWYHKRDKWKDRIEIIIGKRRSGRGPKSTVLGFRGETTTFYEVGTTPASNMGPEDPDGFPL